MWNLYVKKNKYFYFTWKKSHHTLLSTLIYHLQTKKRIVYQGITHCTGLKQQGDSAVSHQYQDFPEIYLENQDSSWLVQIHGD